MDGTQAADCQRLDALRQDVNAALVAFADGLGGPERLQSVCRYVLLSPGKRVRAMLTLLTAEAAGAAPGQALDAAVGVEAVHAASLILDDLPAMDDAATRRGKPTVHREFDEASAILAAIALMNGGYAAVAGRGAIAAQAVAILTRAIGGHGLVGGQILDLYPTSGQSLDDVSETHGAKTGALFAAALALGAIAAEGPVARDARLVERVWTAGFNLGLAFQGYDDLLDRYGTPDRIGKEIGADALKTTVATLLPRLQAEAWCHARLSAGQSALADQFGPDVALIRYIQRMHDMLTAPLLAPGPVQETEVGAVRSASQ